MYFIGMMLKILITGMEFLPCILWKSSEASQEREITLKIVIAETTCEISLSASS